MAEALYFHFQISSILGWILNKYTRYEEFLEIVLIGNDDGNVSEFFTVTESGRISWNGPNRYQNITDPSIRFYSTHDPKASTWGVEYLNNQWNLFKSIAWNIGFLMMYHLGILVD